MKHEMQIFRFLFGKAGFRLFSAKEILVSLDDDTPVNYVKPVSALKKIQGL